LRNLLQSLSLLTNPEIENLYPWQL
jgi:hypothetical protein